MFRLTIHTAKTSAHIFFIFVSPYSLSSNSPAFWPEDTPFPGQGRFTGLRAWAFYLSAWPGSLSIYLPSTTSFRYWPYWFFFKIS